MSRPLPCPSMPPAPVVPSTWLATDRLGRVLALWTDMGGLRPPGAPAVDGSDDDLGRLLDGLTGPRPLWLLHPHDGPADLYLWDHDPGALDDPLWVTALPMRWRRAANRFVLPFAPTLRLEAHLALPLIDRAARTTCASPRPRPPDP